jgi:hypothetical protein
MRFFGMRNQQLPSVFMLIESSDVDPLMAVFVWETAKHLPPLNYLCGFLILVREKILRPFCTNPARF